MVSFKEAQENLIGELKDLFLDGLPKVGVALISAERFREAERSVDGPDREIFMLDTIAEIEMKFDCTLTYTEFDEYEAVHIDWRMCRNCGEAYRPREYHLRNAGLVSDYERLPNFALVQTEDDAMETRHQNLLDDQFGYYMIEFRDGETGRIIGMEGICGIDRVFEYLLSDDEPQG